MKKIEFYNWMPTPEPLEEVRDDGAHIKPELW